MARHFLDYVHIVLRGAAAVGCLDSTHLGCMAPHLLACGHSVLDDRLLSSGDLTHAVTASWDPKARAFSYNPSPNLLTLGSSLLIIPSHPMLQS